MQSVFLSYSFRDQDQGLVAAVERLFASHGIHLVDGRRLGGGSLTKTIRQRIESTEGLVALMTRRDPLGPDRWTTHEWVQDELNHARSKGMRAIALAETGVETSGAYSDHERIPLNRDRALDALLALSETLRIWKQEVGRIVQVKVFPDDRARQLVRRAPAARFHYCLGARDAYTEWRAVEPQVETGGVFLYLAGVRDDHMIRIEARTGDRVYSSESTAQWISVHLDDGAHE